MRLVLIGDTFPPMRTSGAVQLRDLTREFVRQGHEITVLIPDADLDVPYISTLVDGVDVIRLRGPRIKNVGMIRRTFAEWIMPYAMLWGLHHSPLKNAKWEGVVWYSPSIFHTPLVTALKKRLRCRSYLIIRDIFPQWALDMELMRPGPVYQILDWFARRQFQVADVIGVQTPGNLSYFNVNNLPPSTQLDVLQNWIGPAGQTPSPIQIANTPLKGRKIMVYAGNMGVAQSMDIILDLATELRDRLDLGFLFVGRGSDAQRLMKVAKGRDLTNTIFYDEIDPDAIPDLYTQCFGGIVSLDHRHKSHNIPGKFLTYIQAGLPVFAKINPNNDLADVIKDYQVGVSCSSLDIADLKIQLNLFLDEFDGDTGCSHRCKKLYENTFSAAIAVQKIVAAVSN